MSTITKVVTGGGNSLTSRSLYGTFPISSRLRLARPRPPRAPCMNSRIRRERAGKPERGQAHVFTDIRPVDDEGLGAGGEMGKPRAPPVSSVTSTGRADQRDPRDGCPPGDIFEQDSNGFILRDARKTWSNAARNVFAQEAEAVLLTHPWIIARSSAPSVKYGEGILAVEGAEGRTFRKTRSYNTAERLASIRSRRVNLWMVFLEFPGKDPEIQTRNAQTYIT